MIALQPIVDRLKAAGFAQVEGVIEFAGLQDPPRVVPALYVVPEAEGASANRMAGIVDQRVTAAFLVVVVLGGQARADGKVSAELEIQSGRARDALIAWKHPQASGPFEYAGGRLLSVDGYRLAWAVRLTAPYHLRK
ncbi:phage tail terminator protein [Sphingomonas sp. CCH15-F11]|uniref:phage tail terminator protein n=1 Tax=Sphingomonas sp. CCH15-F11 TaxID=1768785 RepID=UPI0008344148|nr:hypothetical protein [Sphingomonas sp. CCH15-F11]